MAAEDGPGEDGGGEGGGVFPPVPPPLQEEKKSGKLGYSGARSGECDNPATRHRRGGSVRDRHASVGVRKEGID